MRVSVRVRLSTMMALIYAVQGAWWPMLALHLGDLGLSGRERGWIFATYPLAAALMSLGAGAFVDRLMPAQRYLSWCYVLGAGFLAALGLGIGADSTLLFGLFLTYWLVTAPTYGISGAIALRNLPDPSQGFGRVRMWGTVGWMAAGWTVSAALGWSGSARGVFEAFWVAGACSIALAAFAPFLPDTPPLARDAKAGGLLGVGPLLKRRAVLVLLVTSFGVSLTTPLVYQVMPTYYESLGLPRRWAASASTLGQWSEIAALAALPWLLRRCGAKTTLLIGMGAWLLRFTTLALRPPLWLAIAGIPLHGIGVACFTVGGQVVLDRHAPSDRRAGAQAIYAVATSGVGALLGSLMAGELLAGSAGDPAGVFFVPCLIHFGLIGFFIPAFRPDSLATARPAVASPPRSTPREASRPAVARLEHFAVESADG
jgi:MFS family permease